MGLLATDMTRDVGKDFDSIYDIVAKKMTIDSLGLQDDMVLLQPVDTNPVLYRRYFVAAKGSSDTDSTSDSEDSFHSSASEPDTPPPLPKPSYRVPLRNRGGAVGTVARRVKAHRIKKRTLSDSAARRQSA